MVGIPVEIGFKGGRNYIHGTDVYECAVSCLRQRWPHLDGRCRFTFHRMTNRPLSAIVDNFGSGTTILQGCVADMHVTEGPHEASVWFVERDGEVTTRYGYDEDAVVRDCLVQANSISLAGLRSNSPIETVVAMTKRLHNAIAKPQQGRWLFTRLDLKRLLRPQDAQALTVTLAGKPRNAISRSEIVTGGELIGSIFFSVGQA